MKLRRVKINLGGVFDPNKGFTTDIAIVLKKNPTKPNEGATVDYVRQKEEEFYKNGIGNIILDDINKLKLEGKDIVHNTSGLYLSNVYKGNKEGIIMKVNSAGLITETLPLEADAIDSTVTIKWGDIDNKPTTIEGYGIKDMVSSEKLDTVTAKTTVTVKPGKGTNPIPYSHLNTIWKNSNYELYIGDVVMKHGVPDKNKWIIANGGKITRANYPEYFVAVVNPHPKGGPLVNEWTIPDCSIRDNYVLNSFGVQAKSYVCVRI